ncbi:dimethylarginine dimethylaminohydrolase family protein [Actinocorallia populi]|uniref:dimethylarginine dimethylaminohydrolase family protein n=1 Tax=Actinocorallia populi TaxID=2079200 RepID=UPI001E3A7631|nr:arginine deiminase family protein [Actinocorallia populi]
MENEFAPLRTVVLAQSEVCIPASALKDPDMRFLPQGADALRFTGDLREADPRRQAAWEAEREAFAAVLRRHGVEVLRPRLLTPAEKSAAEDRGYANFFARDPFFTVGEHVIEGSMRFRHRRGEVLPMRGVFGEHVYPANGSYVAVPVPEVAAPDDPSLGPGPFLEGGDVLVLGRHVFVGASGLASNTLGADWLRKYLAPCGYTVEQVRLHETILHLDCALGLVREGLMVVCEEALLDGIPRVLRTWDRVPVSLADAGRLATNGLPLSPEAYVTDHEFDGIGEQLEHRGVTVEYVDFSITRSLGGAFRCSTQPLHRAP